MSAIRGDSKDALSVSIRQLAASDVPAVLAILHESPEAAAWSRDSLLRMESAGGAMMWVAERNGNVAGFLIGRSVAEEFEILNMAVAGEQRRLGIGSKLLESAVVFSHKTGIARVYLEVRASNEPAIALYKRHGFTECGRRARYYRDPVEDALLLSLSLA
ncbi:MAG: ribosomal protein S18P -alanine acetyltransferase [Candidatus Acidoferrum typicum]|nr:ribosomal protein S18P -alanine acetyltransferase [Candidatus Acidoferrum typicum]